MNASNPRPRPPRPCPPRKPKELSRDNGIQKAAISSSGPGTGKIASSRSSGSEERREIINNTAFTVFCPNEKKRERILKQAEKEEAAYESHKRATRLTHLQMQPQRLGSGEERLASLPDVRARQQRQLTQHGPFRAAENVRNTRLQAAKEEESQLQLRKQEAREKAQQRNNAQATKNETVDAATLRLKRLQFLGL